MIGGGYAFGFESIHVAFFCICLQFLNEDIHRHWVGLLSVGFLLNCITWFVG